MKLVSCACIWFSVLWHLWSEPRHQASFFLSPLSLFVCVFKLIGTSQLKGNFHLLLLSLARVISHTQHTVSRSLCVVTVYQFLWCARAAYDVELVSSFNVYSETTKQTAHIHKILDIYDLYLCVDRVQVILSVGAIATLAVRGAAGDIFFLFFVFLFAQLSLCWTRQHLSWKYNGNNR